jgi:hypothetical protein
VSISRRRLLAVGLVLASVGTVGFATVTAAGAQTVPNSAVRLDHPTVTAAQLTESTGEYAPKGRPPRQTTEAAGAVRSPMLAANATTYMYGVGSQSATADGMYATLSMARPQLAPGDFHTLAELAAESADGQQIVEIGWTVDRSINSDDAPHLFVYHWVNGAGSCYNGCGFVQASSSARPGMSVPSDGSKYFGIEQYQGNWWVMYDTEWVGYFPNSLWSGRFTQLGLAQWFGEVAAGSAAPCTDMGNGNPASSANAASFSGVGFFNGPAVRVNAAATNSTWYSARRVTANSFRFGGPGAC